jgi:hypothetical protein
MSSSPPQHGSTHLLKCLEAPNLDTLVVGAVEEARTASQGLLLGGGERDLIPHAATVGGGVDQLIVGIDAREGAAGAGHPARATDGVALVGGVEAYVNLKADQENSLA